MEPSRCPRRSGTMGDTTVTPIASRQHRPVTPWHRQPAARIAWALIAASALVLLNISHSDRMKLRRREGELAPPHRRQLTVFGDDDRQAVTNPASSPYSAVGLLKWSADRNCTAALIDPKYALTAADCVFQRDGTRRPSTLPKPELAFAGASAISHVVKIHRQSTFWQQWTQETYAILELDTKVSETLGKLLLPTAGALDQSGGKTPVQMVGFDGNVATSAKPELKFAKCTCFFPATFNGPQYMLHHNCDTSANGSPGSVLLVRYADMQTYIIGIHTNTIGEAVPAVESDRVLPDAGYSDVVANRGVLAPFMQQHLEAILRNATFAPESTEANSSLVGSSTGSSTGSLAVTAAPPTPVPNGGGGNDSTVEMVSNTETRISAEMAYACIGIVAAAWITISFIILRHVRRRT